MIVTEHVNFYGNWSRKKA